MKGTNGFYPRVALGYVRKTNPDLLAFVRNVITLMKDNSQYPAPQPALADIATSADLFEGALHDALDGGRLALAARNAARVALLALMRLLAAYVQGNCNADVLALLGSGFDAVRAPSLVGVLSAPQNLRLGLSGTSGKMVLRFDRIANSVNYSVQTAVSADGPWLDWGLSTSTRVPIDGLTPGHVLWARACANGSAGPSGWSQPATGRSL